MASDTPMADAPTPGPDDVPTLSPGEERIVALFDRLQQLQLQIALVRARQTYIPESVVDPSDPAALRTAQNRLLDARAAYTLRNAAVESVLCTTPTLNAVHGAPGASVVERDLENPIRQRDAVSAAVARQTAELHGTLERLTRVEAEALATSRRNVDLASEVLRLAERDAARRRTPDGDNAKDDEVARLEGEVRWSRYKWRLMKGTAAAAVVGCGVDWARDEELRELVLDPE